MTLQVYVFHENKAQTPKRLACHIDTIVVYLCCLGIKHVMDNYMVVYLSIALRTKSIIILSVDFNHVKF